MQKYLLFLQKNLTIIWSVEDVMERAKEAFDMRINDLEAMTILDEVEKNLDTDRGMIGATFDEYLADLKLTKAIYEE